MRWQFRVPDAAAMTTVAVAIDDAPLESGPIEVYVGQHGRLLTRPGAVEDPGEDDVDPRRRRAIELDAGDALLLHPLIPHRSEPNRSDAPRRVLYLTYARASLGDLYDSFYELYRLAMLDMRDGGAGDRAFYT
jgi:ectoine hydroxylase-related dioxygenase (phytanoyl-CoA dioxygenase family)